MNAKRGLIRVWLLLTVLWLAAVGVAFAHEWENYTDWNLANPHPTVDEWLGSPVKPSLMMYAGVATGAPVLLFSLGLGVWWAVSGFRA